MAGRTEEIGDNKTIKRKKCQGKIRKGINLLALRKKRSLDNFLSVLFSSDFSIIGNFLELLHVQEYLCFADSKDRN